MQTESSTPFFCMDSQLFRFYFSLVTHFLYTDVRILLYRTKKPDANASGLTLKELQDRVAEVRQRRGLVNDHQTPCCENDETKTRQNPTWVFDRVR